MPPRIDQQAAVDQGAKVTRTKRAMYTGGDGVPGIPTSDPQQVVQSSVVLHVSDVKQTAEYYRDVLNFKLDFIMGDPAEYAVVWRDNGSIHFSGAESGAESSNVSLFVWVLDVDSYHEELLATGANIQSEPKTQPYGIRDFAVDDPNGIRIVFGQDDELMQSFESE